MKRVQGVIFTPEECDFFIEHLSKNEWFSGQAYSDSEGWLTTIISADARKSL